MHVMPKPPDTLYHYTTQTGLLGILASDSLWATKIHYLNDSAEYQLAFNLAKSFFDRLFKGERSTKKRTKIKTLVGNLSTIARMNVCVCSFTHHGDLLSQWRAYAGGIAGFSVGFRSENLLQRAEEQGFVLAKCIYNLQEQQDLIENLITASLAEEFNTVGVKRHPTNPWGLIIQPTGGAFKKNFACLASILKDQAFHEEDEWRLISRSGISVKNMSFRPTQSMLAPYTLFALGAEKDRYLHSLVVGPTPHPDLSKESIHSLLAHWNVVQTTEIRTSSAPYRAW